MDFTSGNYQRCQNNLGRMSKQSLGHQSGSLVAFRVSSRTDKKDPRNHTKPSEQKFRVQRNYLKEEVRGRVSLVMPDVTVPPIICAAKDGQMFEDKDLSIERMLLENRNRTLNLFALVRLKSIGTNQERDIPNY